MTTTLKNEHSNPIERWVIEATIDYVKEMFIRRYKSGHSIACMAEQLPKVSGKFQDESVGWFVLFEGAGECIYLQDEEPNLHAGDKVKITIEKVS